jgi:hypothetical protein
MPRTKSGLLTLFTYTLTGLCAQRIMCFPFMVYLISCIYDMTPLRGLYVTCITIIDTIILNIHTYDAYIFVLSGVRGLHAQTVDSVYGSGSRVWREE